MMDDLNINSYWPDDGCLACGKRRNKWCDEWHLSNVEAEAVRMRQKLERFETSLSKYKAASPEER